MKLTRLELKNVRCYEHLDIPFIITDDEGKDQVRMRTIILGNNGTGKSTILRSIALALCGSSALGQLVGEPDNWIRRGKKSCLIRLELVTVSGEPRKIELKMNRGDNLSKLMSRNEESLAELDEALEHTQRNYLTIGYGVNRRVGSTHLRETNEYRSFRAENVSTLFDTHASLHPLVSWIMDLDYREGPKGLATIKRALNRLLPDVSFYKIDKDNRTVLFKNKDGIVEFSQLSDGFQISANWLGDLLYRITNTYRDYDKPFEARFILLIDEIALHLHPGWQRTIIQSISDLFPNAQIVATTHSPFVAQQAGDSELFTIMREGKNLDLFHYENDPRKLLIHQIVMSDLFGLATDESVAVEEAKKEVRNIPEVSSKKSKRPAKTGVQRTRKKKTASKDDAVVALKKLRGVDSWKDLPVRTREGGIQTEQSDQDPMSELMQELKRLRNEKAGS